MDDFNQTTAKTSDAIDAAADVAKSQATDAKHTANQAIATGREYAHDAINAAGKKIDNAKSQLAQTSDYLAKAINDEPVKAVVITAVISSLLTGLLMAALRTDNRYF